MGNFIQMVAVDRRRAVRATKCSDRNSARGSE